MDFYLTLKKERRRIHKNLLDLVVILLDITNHILIFSLLEMAILFEITFKKVQARALG